MIRLLVGLGNPGPQYLATRHNAGFWWLQEMASRLGASLAMDRTMSGFVGRINRPGGEPLWLLQPQTFMNLSGRSVGALARFYKIAPDEILVAHDELDLPPGQVRVKKGGGHGGHNGLRDIHAQLGSPDYWRLRIGIGHPGVKSEVADFVLRKPPASERELIEGAIDRAIAERETLMAAQMDKAMMVLHPKEGGARKAAPKDGAAVRDAPAGSPARPEDAGGPAPS